MDWATYLEQENQWRQQRAATLSAPRGWLAVAGLLWLQEGDNLLGSSDLPLPQRFGGHAIARLHWHGSEVQIHSLNPQLKLAGEPFDHAELHPDVSGQAQLLEFHDVALMLLKRGERLALRLWDAQNPARTQFSGLNWFEPKAEYRLMARFVPHEQPQSIPIVNLLGDVAESPSPGYLEFDLGGQTHRLIAESNNPSQYLFINFKDHTNGKQTYGASRFLHTGGVQDGWVALDFNRAANPPCAFTPFATCPLPPLSNRLPLAIEAGEMRFEGIAL